MPMCELMFSAFFYNFASSAYSVEIIHICKTGTCKKVNNRALYWPIQVVLQKIF